MRMVSFKLRAAALRLVLSGSVLLALLPGAAAAAMPAPPAQQTGCASVVTVQPGDTLSGIARRHLGAPGAWVRIVAATNARAAAGDSFVAILNANYLSPGTRLCIPAAGSASAVASSGNTPTATPVATAAPPTPVPPASATPTAVPATPTADEEQEIDPAILTLEWLRAQKTPGSQIVIEEVLDPASNYDRYLASYRSEGLKIYAYLTVPQGTPPETGWPVVVFNHGYIPPEVYRPTERYIAYQDAFARNGYIVFRPDYRGHGFSEGEARGGYGSPDYTLDVLNALASIRQYEGADPERVGMWGHSMGGFITLRVMVANPDVKAGVIWAGVVASYPEMIANWTRRPNAVPASIPPRARRWRQVLQEKMGTPEENPAYWASISSNSYLADLSGPVQLHHGTADGDVPVEFSRTLEDQILAAGGTVEYYEYAGDDHNLSASLGTALQRSVAFFDEHVKNAE